MVFRRIMASLGAAALLGGSAVGLAPAASAQDVGDGSVDCNVGEICILRSLNSPLQNHFWYDASHDGYDFYHTSDLYQTTVDVRDGAGAVRNRDTACTVRVIDDRGIVVDDWHDVTRGSWVNLISSVAYENDRHERCP